MGAVITVGLDRSYVQRYWGSCHEDTVLGADGVPIDPQERGLLILTCRDQKVPWSTIWPGARYYG